MRRARGQWQLDRSVNSIHKYRFTPRHDYIIKVGVFVLNNQIYTGLLTNVKASWGLFLENILSNRLKKESGFIQLSSLFDIDHF